LVFSFIFFIKKEKKMTIEFVSHPSDIDWLDVRNAALITRRQHSNVVPSKILKLRFLCSEHSPIRGLNYRWVWNDQKYWIAMHIRTHSIGISQYVSSQRNDRQEVYDRNKAPQDAPVEHMCYANAQSIINISKARECLNASKETRQAWLEFVDALKVVEPQLARLCVPPCVYRNGICPEVFNHCGYNHTPKFILEVEEYRNIFFGFEKKGKPRD
jgi:hypothetical protein